VKGAESGAVAVASPGALAFVLAGEKSGIIQWSSGAEKLLRYKGEQVIGKPFEHLLSPQAKDFFFQIRVRLRSMGSTSCVLPMLALPKAPVSFQWLFSLVEDSPEDMKFSALGVPEEGCLFSVEFLHLVLEAVRPEAAVLLDDEGRVIDANTAAISMFGQCLGHFGREFFPSHEEWRAALVEARRGLQKERSFSLKVRVKISGDRILPVAISGSPLAPFGSFFVIVRDLSQKEELEKEKKALETRLRILGYRLMQLQQEERIRLATELHDEISQKLTLLRWKVSRIDAQTLSSEKLAKECGEVMEMVDALYHDLGNLVTRLRNPQFEELSLREALLRKLEFFNKAFELPCSISFVGEIPNLRGAKRHVALCVVQEAYLNAVRHAKATQVCISVERKPEELVISIADDGIGMSPKELKRALGSPGMWGMALRAEAVDGYLEVTSEKGKGTRVTLHLPLGPGETE